MAPLRSWACKLKVHSKECPKGSFRMRRLIHVVKAVKQDKISDLKSLPCKAPGTKAGTFTPSYCNFPKFSDRQVWANSVDPDQTAPRGAV